MYSVFAEVPSCISSANCMRAPWVAATLPLPGMTPSAQGSAERCITAD